MPEPLIEPTAALEPTTYNLEPTTADEQLSEPKAAIASELSTKPINEPLTESTAASAPEQNNSPLVSATLRGRPRGPTKLKILEISTRVLRSGAPQILTSSVNINSRSQSSSPARNKSALNDC